MWIYIKGKYDIHDAAKRWVFVSIQNAWRKYKNQLFNDHYKAYENDELQMEKRLVDVPKSQFRDLLNYWNSDAYKKMSQTNIENCKKLKYPHTAGKRSFARICEDEMERIQSTQESENGSQSVNAFASVIGPEHPGCLRLYGRGVTKTSLKRKVGDFGPSLSSTDEVMQQKLEEMEERMQQRLQEKFNSQKDTMKLQVAVNIISQLKHPNPDLRVNPSMLGFNTRSPGEASSAQQAAVQLINRLSTRSNNQGGAIEEREDGDCEDLGFT
ncbi:uncharacterized protein LOC107785794 isoform X3 [Nicotiana tabacum]|uniref:Uncharacterized protein LOC107785794 isoform X3 n=1 Tax=Nicotiana tabacum TaxID=4097 RepID=A0AC58U8T6_TOBAC